MHHSTTLAIVLDEGPQGSRVYGCLPACTQVLSLSRTSSGCLHSMCLQLYDMSTDFAHLVPVRIHS